MIIEHDSHNSFYRTPFGACETGSEVTLRLLVFGDRLPSSVTLHVIKKHNKEEIKMDHTGEIISHNIFECKLIIPDEPMVIWYYFEIHLFDGMFFYGNNLRAKGGIGLIYDNEPKFKYQITVYKAGYKTPDWFKSRVMYQIFPDRFYNGNEDKSINKKDGAIIHKTWNESPFYKAKQFGGQYLCNDFFGGNLKGIIKKLDYLKELGISVLYLNPIFEGFSNHRYDTGSYENIDPILGTIDDFETLCKEADNRDIRIILDGVFSHTGSDSVYFNKLGRYDSLGAYQSKESPYYSWYNFYEYPDKYESWWGIDTLPNVKELNESYRNYILNSDNAIVKKWLKQGAYGWRLDVVDELPDEFLKELRREVKKENKDAVIIGEVWEDASNKESYGVLREYFLGEELDSVMNYKFKNAVIDFVCNIINGPEFNLSLMSLLENYPKESMYSVMNILSTHDVLRIRHAMAQVPSLDREQQARYILTDYQRWISKQRQMIAVIMQMTFVGVPCVYYGDEVGMNGYEDPFNRQTFPWKFIDNELLEFYKKVINVRNETNVLKFGEFKPIYIDKDVYSFVRYIRDNKDALGNYSENGCVLVVINVSEQKNSKFYINLGEFKVNKVTDLLTNESVFTDDGEIKIAVEKLGYKIFNCE